MPLRHVDGESRVAGTQLGLAGAAYGDIDGEIRKRAGHRRKRLGRGSGNEDERGGQQILDGIGQLVTRQAAHARRHDRRNPRITADDGDAGIGLGTARVR